MALTGHQRQQFSEALRDAFSFQRLTELLQYRLEKNLADVSLGADYRAVAFALIQAAEAEGWTGRLLQAALESNPGNAKLVEFAQQLGLTSVDSPGTKLERIVRQSNRFVDIAAWRSQLGLLEARVCRVDIPGGGGTGFLVADDIAITNYHVMRDVVEGSVSPEDVRFRFDYKRLMDGKTLNAGIAYRMAKDWLIIKSEDEAVGTLPQSDQLDFALVRLDGNPGALPIGAGAEPGAPVRGFVGMPNRDPSFDPGTPLLIIQHPQGTPLKLAFDTDAVVGLNSNRTRVTYRTNTESGSSGSPCFDQDWQLVALHQGRASGQNVGIPISAILKHLESRNLADLLKRGSH